MNKPDAKIVVVMPAYNAEKTLQKTYDDLPREIIDEVVLVDDGSHDRTVEIAKGLDLTTFVHPQNLGYGGNQKTCYTQALKQQADIVVMVHPDYQYDATLVPQLIQPILENRFDVMLGSRIRSRQEALSGGMPPYKYFANRFLTLVENIVLGLNLSEYHTGFRAFKREALQKIPFELFSNDFVFDQEILISAAALGFRIGEIPVPTRYFPDASSINFKCSIKYGLGTLIVLFRLILHRLGFLDPRLLSASD